MSACRFIVELCNKALAGCFFPTQNLRFATDLDTDFDLKAAVGMGDARNNYVLHTNLLKE